MALARALRVERGAVVSFTGGGGKTTSMFRLASELSSAGLRVVTATTTHISEEQTRLAPAAIRLEELDQLSNRLDRFRHCLIIGLPDGKGRIFGASPGLIRELHKRPDVDVVLVEADGSRSRPFKAPGDHEPVVPEVTTILVPIAGLNAIGLPLDEDHTHRSEIIASLTGQPQGAPVTSATVARVLAHPRGGAKQLPSGARLVPLLNKADTDDRLKLARETARELLANPTVDTVAVTAMTGDPPVREAWVPAAAVVLAAGMSTRFGGILKQALPWQDTTLAAHAARAALDAGLDPVVVVLGYEAEKVEKTLAGLPVQAVFNPDFAAGQSASIRKGLETLPARAGAALFVLADQPLVTPDLMRGLIDAHRRTFAPACVPVFEGKRGNPVLFDRSLFDKLQELHGDTGGRSLLERYSEAVVTVAAGPGAVTDIDTCGDYERLTSGHEFHEPEK